MPPATFKITKGWPGTYTNPGGVSWYLNGNTSSDREIHFTVHNNLNRWHMSYVIDGSNIQMYYNGATFSNVALGALPAHKTREWNDWIAANWQKCDDAAADFNEQFG
jgi:hypothetical protein